MRLARLADRCRNGKRNYVRKDETNEREVGIMAEKQGFCHKNLITLCTMNQLDAYVSFLAGLCIGCKVNRLDEYLVKGRLPCLFTITCLSIFFSFYLLYRKFSLNTTLGRYLKSQNLMCT